MGQYIDKNFKLLEIEGKEILIKQLFERVMISQLNNFFYYSLIKLKKIKKRGKHIQ